MDFKDKVVLITGGSRGIGRACAVAFVLITVIVMVDVFNNADYTLLLMGPEGGPNGRTDIMGTFFYRTFFGQQLQLGNPTMGATVAAMMFLIILTGVLLYMFLWARRVQTYDL